MEIRFKIIVMPLAEEGLCNIQDYIFSLSKDLEMADRVVRRIGAYISENLSYFPFMGRVLNEYKLKTKDVRRITAEKRYNIYYYVDEHAQEIYILKIADGRQSIERQLHGL